MVVAGKESKERLVEVLQMLKNTNNPQVEYFVQVMKKWGKDNGFKF
jgi:intraflagellar transport protein 56